jgi:hypothetical protein
MEPKNVGLLNQLHILNKLLKLTNWCWQYFPPTNRVHKKFKLWVHFLALHNQVARFWMKHCSLYNIHWRLQSKDYIKILEILKPLILKYGTFVFSNFGALQIPRIVSKWNMQDNFLPTKSILSNVVSRFQFGHPFASPNDVLSGLGVCLIIPS